MKTLLNLFWFTALAAYPQSTQTLTVLVHDYARLTDAAVHDWQTLSSVLLSRSGIMVEWVWCNTERRDARSALCDANLEPGRIVLRILTRYPGKNKRSGDALGMAEIQGSFASLFQAEIRHYADQNGLPFGHLMAYAAVHEIGHLLLGSEHSQSGVMKAKWGRAEYRDMASRWLAFSQAESEAMRRGIS